VRGHLFLGAVVAATLRAAPEGALAHWSTAAAAHGSLGVEVGGILSVGCACLGRCVGGRVSILGLPMRAGSGSRRLLGCARACSWGRGRDRGASCHACVLYGCRCGRSYRFRLMALFWVHLDTGCPAPASCSGGTSAPLSCRPGRSDRGRFVLSGRPGGLLCVWSSLGLPRRRGGERG
jgi:hypothetical protein